MMRRFWVHDSSVKVWSAWVLAAGMALLFSLGGASGAISQEFTVFHTNNVTGHLFGCPT
jgi:hypothetical protein